MNIERLFEWAAREGIKPGQVADAIAISQFDERLSEQTVQHIAWQMQVVFNRGYVLGLQMAREAGRRLS